MKQSVNASKIMASIKISDLFLVAYLCTQFVVLTNQTANLWVCRGLFTLYVITAFLFDVLPRQLKVKDRFFNGFTVWTIGFFSLCLLSALWSISIDFSLDNTYINNIIHIVIIAMFMSYSIRTDKDLRKYAALLLIVILYMAVALVIKTPATSWGTERVGEAINLNCNSVGMMCAVGCLIILYLQNGLTNKWLIPFIAPLLLLALFSGSRKAFVLLLLFLGGYPVFKSKGFSKAAAFVLLLVFATVLYSVVMTDPDLYNVIGQRIEQVFFSLTGQDVTDQSVIERSYYRSQALVLFCQNPIIGIGMNGFMAYMAQIGYSHVAYSHCNYTELLCNFGFIGFIFYYGLSLFLLKEMVMSAGSACDRNNLFFALVLLLGVLVSDYGMVSYASIDNIIYLCLIYSAVKLSRVEAS